MYNNKFDKAFERIKNIEAFNYESCVSHRKSIRVLLNEYFRRLCVWADYLNYDKERWQFMPFFDVKNLNNENLAIYDFFQEQFNNEKLNNRFVGQTIYNLRHYINWEIKPVEVLESDKNLLPPYEPFILLLERGGYGIQIDKSRFFDVGCNIKEKANWDYYINLPAFDINSERLDLLDCCIS